jgi:hypothetical protein
MLISQKAGKAKFLSIPPEWDRKRRRPLFEIGNVSNFLCHYFITIRNKSQCSLSCFQHFLHFPQSCCSFFGNIYQVKKQRKTRIPPAYFAIIESPGRFVRKTSPHRRKAVRAVLV